MVAKQRRKHLFVALSRSGWGETSLGVQVARQVIDAGDSVSFIAHTKSMPALAEACCEIAEVSDATVRYIGLLFESSLLSRKFSSIVLCDFLTTNYTLNYFGLDPARIFKFDVPMITLDTWDYNTTGAKIDVAGDGKWEIGSWIEQMPRRLVPVPIGRPVTPGAYCSLPSPLKIARHTRRHIRKNLGVNDTERAVLFCTAAWQHVQNKPTPNRLHAGRFEAAVPHLLASYLAQLEPGVRLIHVGPQALPIEMQDGRYLWMPPLTPNDFDRVLNSVDMVLSVNVSATTIGRAIVAGVPVLIVKNSYAATTVEELEAVSESPISPSVRTWLEKALPIFPFSMWPLGFWHFLKPLLEDNPYSSVTDIVELTDESAFLEAARRLLFDTAKRDQAIQRQASYVNLVKQLPTAAQLIDGYLQ